MDDLRNIKVKVKNLVGGIVLYTSDARHVRREWTSQDQIIPIPADELEEVLYDTGIKELFTEGYLGIDNPDHRVLVGLDFEDDKCIPFAKADAIKCLAKDFDIEAFEEFLKNIKGGQREVLIKTAYEIKDIPYDKERLIDNYLGIDISKILKLND